MLEDLKSRVKKIYDETPPEMFVAMAGAATLVAAYYCGKTKGRIDIQLFLYSKDGNHIPIGTAERVR